MNDEIPFEFTNEGQCPDCQAGLVAVEPHDPDCEVFYCAECGFNEPADEDGDQ